MSDTKTPTTFKNLIELSNFFQDETICRKYLEKLLWNDKPVCPHCGGDHVYSFSDGRRYKCGKKECRKQFTVTVGTFFESSKIPLRKWFHAIYIFTSHKKGVSSHQLSKDISITQKSAWFILSRIRGILKDKAPFMLTGVVEIDETYVGGKLKNKHKTQRKRAKPGRGSQNKTMVFGLKEKDGKVYNEMVADATRLTLHKIMVEKVAKGSTIVTDGFHVYKRLAGNYNHVIVDHDKDVFVIDGLTTNNIECYWSHLKRGILGIYHQVSPKHLHRYCNEFAFRYNSRKISEVDRFDLALTQVTGRLKYDELIQKDS